MSQRNSRQVFIGLLLTIASQLFFSFSVVAAESAELTVTATYIDVRTGPGKGYPVTHVVERHEKIDVEKLRTDWFYIRTRDRLSEHVGWVHRDDLTGSVFADGAIADFGLPGRAELTGNRWVLTGMGGDFGGADSLSFSLGYRMTENLTLEGRIGRAIGDFSDSEYAYLRLSSEPFPTWRVSPFFVLGTGTINTSPNTQLVQSVDRTDGTMLVGVGLQTYLSRNFTLRLEYDQHLVLTNREINEDVNEWQLGFSVSF